MLRFLATDFIKSIFISFQLDLSIIYYKLVILVSSLTCIFLKYFCNQILMIFNFMLKLLEIELLYNICYLFYTINIALA